MARMVFWLPVAILLVLCALLAVSLSQHPHEVPSAMVGRHLPEFNLPLLDEPHHRFDPHELPKQVMLLNVWASWCAACAEEHPVIADIAHRETVPVYSIVYRDSRRRAKQWLRRHGNPYDSVALDSKGQAGVRLGIAGTPETYVIDQRHVVRYIHRGPLTRQLWQDKIQPMVQRLRKEAG